MAMRELCRLLNKRGWYLKLLGRKEEALKHYERSYRMSQVRPSAPTPLHPSHLLHTCFSHTHTHSWCTHGQDVDVDRVSYEAENAIVRNWKLLEMEAVRNCWVS